jgi:hypothetical protein
MVSLKTTIILVGGAVGISALILFSKQIISGAENLGGEVGSTIGSAIGGSFETLVESLGFGLTHPNCPNPYLPGGSGGTNDTTPSPGSVCPSKALINPATGTEESICCFAKTYPTLYTLIESVKLPACYEKNYLAGTTNVQPIDYASASNPIIQAYINNPSGSAAQLTAASEIEQANVALGANPVTGEFATCVFQLSDGERLALTPYEQAQYEAQGVKLTKTSLPATTVLNPGTNLGAAGIATACPGTFIAALTTPSAKVAAPTPAPSLQAVCYCPLLESEGLCPFTDSYIAPSQPAPTPTPAPSTLCEETISEILYGGGGSFNTTIYGSCPGGGSEGCFQFFGGCSGECFGGCF